MLDEFIKYLLQEVENHSIYVIGGQGKRGKEVTEEWIRSRESDAKNADRAVNAWKKQCQAGYADKLGAFDCSGLGMYFLQNLKGIFPSDLNSNGMKGKCTEITREQVKKGDWVFMLSGTRATHIGFVVDDEKNVVEARGRDYGVCKTSFNSRGWQYFGRPEIFKSEIEGAAPDVFVKKGDKGDAVLALQYGLLLKGYKLEKYGADGNFGTETKMALNMLQQDNNLTKGDGAGKSEASILGFDDSFTLSQAARLLYKRVLLEKNEKGELEKKLELIKQGLEQTLSVI